MTTRAVAEMDDWDTVPFGGGYAGLRDLADTDFSGIVQSGTAKCCLLNGTVVGVLDGSIENFEDADGTAYEAPTPALPLLALMQERGDEVEAKYYTEDTPLSEVDSKLSKGGFSGFVELSENVLSGDYYVVYHAGRSMSVAWVGNMGELLTDDEAFRRADDEVGIYEVRQVDVEPVEIPGPSDGAGGTTAGGVATGVANSGGTDGANTDATPGTDATDEVDAGGVTSAGDPGAGVTSGADTGGVETDTDGQETGVNPGGAPASETGSSGATDARPEAGQTSGSGGSDSPDRSGSTGAVGATGTSEPPVDERSDDGDVSADRERVPSEAAGDGDEPTTTTRSRESVEGSTEPTEDTAPTADESTADGADHARERDAASTADVERDAASTGGSTGARRERTGGVDHRDAAPEEGEPSDAESAGTAGSRSGGSRRRESTASEGADTVEPGGAGRDADSGAVSPAERLATRSVPSLDPARTTDDDDDASAGVAGGAVGTGGTPASSGASETTSRTPSSPGETSSSGPQRETGGTGRDPGESRSDTSPRGGSAGTTGEPSSGASGGGGTGGGPTAGDSAGASAERRELEAELEERDAEIDRLESELATVESEREDLRRELEAVREERATLQSERDELAAELEEREAELDQVRAELRELEAEFGGATDAERRLTPSEALDGTNLFVRYASKGKATLESAHGGSASREEVSENLNLELHTGFEADSTTVGAQPYEQFLVSTLQYRFVHWVVNDLVWEIRDTGKVAALEDLYDAIPNIDRAELDGTVTVEFTEDGQQRRSDEAFDVVLRDRMGNPLVVANLNDSREAADQGMMDTLVTAASRVRESSPSMAAAVFVTSSFFEPEALETVADATGGSLLSRDKRESFVKLSRKQGYHLCLAEARDEQFHLAVPDL